MGYPNFGEADPGGLGACPQQNSTLSSFLLFPEKEAKSVGLLCRKRFVIRHLLNEYIPFPVKEDH
jgi:hypothetical protein